MAVRADPLWLRAATVVFGIIFGLMKEAFGSVLFPVLTHAAFDVVTYGDLTFAPWWVSYEHESGWSDSAASGRSSTRRSF